MAEADGVTNADARRERLLVSDNLGPVDQLAGRCEQP